jgi:acetyl-CoA acyltransferase
VVVGEAVANEPDRRPVWILGSVVSMGSPPGSYEPTIRRVANEAYQQAGVGPDQISVAEVHDATAFTELVAAEELCLCRRGEGGLMAERGDSTIGGRLPINPSGGLESRGHPMAATGVAQIVELVSQLRGAAGERQVPNASYALAETAGGFAGGDTAAVAVHILGRRSP